MQGLILHNAHGGGIIGYFRSDIPGDFENNAMVTQGTERLVFVMEILIHAK